MINFDSFTSFGLPGVVIAALFALVYFLVREHKAERNEWITAYREQSTLMDERQRETNQVIRELVVVVRESNASRRSSAT